MPTDSNTQASQSAMPSSSTRLAALKRRRATIKSSCTRTENFVINISEITSDVIAQLDERKARLDLHWNEYDIVQSEIESLNEQESSDRAISIHSRQKYVSVRSLR